MAENGNISMQDDDVKRSRSRSPINKDSRDMRESRENRRRGNRDGDRGDRERRSRAPSTCRVYVANIPYDMKWQDLKDLFREKVGEVAFVELFEDMDGKARGCGIVEFKEADLVNKAIDVLHRAEVRGRQIVVKEDFDIARDKTGRPLPKSDRGGRGNNMGGGGGGGGNMGGGNMGGMSSNMGSLNNLNLGNLGQMGSLSNLNMNKYGNTYGLSPQFLESLGISGPLTCKVFVANLDYNVTERKLREIFKMAGRVTNVELKVDKDGKSKGHGTVEFEHPVEAVQAISMFNSQILFDRKMSVRMDKYSEDEIAGGIPSKLPSGLKGIGMGLGAGGQPLTNVASLSGMNNMGGGGGGMTSNMPMMNAGMGMGGGGDMAAGMGGLSSAMGGTGGGMGMGGGLAAGLGIGTGGMGTAMGGMGAGNTSLMGGNMNAMGTTGMGANMGSMGTSNFGAANPSMNDMGRRDFSDYMERDYRSGGNDYNNTSRSSSMTDTVCVRNLPPNFTWQNLRDRFRDIGDVMYAEMRGKTFGVVRYASEREARRAVNLMDGARIDGRAIEVFVQ